MRGHHAGTWSVLALALALTLLAVALARPAEVAVAPASVTIHDHGRAAAVEPGSARYREMGALAGRLVGAARTEMAALALPWEAAERCKREQVALEVVFAAPGVRAGVHGAYAMALIPLDQAHEPGRVLVYLGAERYTLLVPADADEELARLCELAKVAAPPGRWWPLPPTVAPGGAEAHDEPPHLWSYYPARTLRWEEYSEDQWVAFRDESEPVSFRHPAAWTVAVEGGGPAGAAVYTLGGLPEDEDYARLFDTLLGTVRFEEPVQVPGGRS